MLLPAVRAPRRAPWPLNCSVPHLKQGWLSKGELDGFRSILTARTAELKEVRNCAVSDLFPTFVLPLHSYSFSTAPVVAQYAGNASAPQLAADCAAKAIPLNKIATLDTGHTYTLAAELIRMCQTIAERLETINNAVLSFNSHSLGGYPLCAGPALLASPQFGDYVRNLLSTFGEVQDVAEVALTRLMEVR